MIQTISNSSRMRFLRSPLTCLTLGLSVLTADLAADDLYFRPETGGDPIASGGTYTWDLTETNWYDDSTTGTAQAWNQGDVARLWTEGTSPGYVTSIINVGADITLGGLYTRPIPGGSSGDLLVRLQTGTAATLTFTPGSVIDTGGQDYSRRLDINGFNIVGDATIAGRTVFRSPTSFNGGTLTVSSGGVIGFTGVTDARVVLDGGSLRTAGVDFSIAHLSGTGTLGRESSGTRTITLNQSENTVLNGRMVTSGVSVYNFRKEGSGAFVLNNMTGSLSNVQNLTSATNSTLLINTTDTSSTGATVHDYGARTTENVTMFTGAEFGGVGTMRVDGDVVFSSLGGSVLSAGSGDVDGGGNLIREAGDLTFVLTGGDFRGASDATFDFYMDGNDAAISSIVIEGTGGFDLEGFKTVNLVGLGEGLLVADTYTLITIGSDITKELGWDIGWVIGENSTGYDIDSYGWNGNEFQVSFVPEMGTIFLPISTIVFVLLVRRRPFRMASA